MSDIKRFDMTVTDYVYMEDCRSESVIGEVSGGNYVLHSDYLAEVERLQARVAELEAEEEGAKEAFGVIFDKMKDLRSRNLQIEKTIHRQVIEISRLYRSGARPLGNEADKAGGTDNAG